MSARLAAGIWVSAYLKRLQGEGIPAYVIARGDDTAGEVLVKLALMDGNARAFMRAFDFQLGDRVWQLLYEGTEREVDDAIERQRGFDPDLWVIEVEDPRGRHMLGQMG